MTDKKAQQHHTTSERDIERPNELDPVEVDPVAEEKWSVRNAISERLTTNMRERNKLQQSTVGYLLHFDLRVCSSDDRSETHELIHSFATAYKFELAGSSVYLLERGEKSSELDAKQLWHALSIWLHSSLKHGDKFFLHYGLGTGTPGTIRQIVGRGESSLDHH